MNEMKPEDVMRALELCTSPERDANCPINCPYGDVGSCDQLLMAHSLAVILELENRLKECENGYAGTLHIERCKLHDAERKLAEKDAEIERLTVELQAMRGAANSYKMHIVEQKKELTERKMMAEMHRFTVEEIRAEAITEFSDRLIKKCDAPNWCVWMSEIEDLAKEMKGEPG